MSEEITKEELINALRVIKAVCKSQIYTCRDCPLGGGCEGCLLKDMSPDGWKINDTEKTVWRALI